MTIDGHQPLVVGSYPRVVTDYGAGAIVVDPLAALALDRVTYRAANGRPARWSESLPAWDETERSNVRRGRNKKGQTSKVLRHGRAERDVVQDDNRTVVRMTDAQMARWATDYVRLACMACAEVREACEACDGAGEIDGADCRECASGCGCMPNVLGGQTVSFAEVVIGGLATATDAPTLRNRDAYASDDAYVKAIERRQRYLGDAYAAADDGVAATPRPGIAWTNSDLGSLVIGATNGVDRDALAEHFAPSRTGANRRQTQGAWPTRQTQPSATYVTANGQRRRRLSSPAQRRAAGVTVLSERRHGGRTVLGRKRGAVTELVAYGDGGYWLGHRFHRDTPTVARKRARRVMLAARATAPASATETVAQISERVAAGQAELDDRLSHVLRTLSALADGETTTVDGATVTRRGSRYAVDGTMLPRTRAAARLMVAAV